MKKQIVFTRSDKMTQKQKDFFDLLAAWGRNRFELLLSMAGTMFTDEDLKHPEDCIVKLNSVLIGMRGGSVDITPAVIHKEETPTEEPTTLLDRVHNLKREREENYEEPADKKIPTLDDIDAAIKQMQ